MLIIEGAVDYAANLGFKAHLDYRKYKVFIGDVDKTACPVKYDFGQGKPWQYDNLYAPFDFAVQKTEEEIVKHGKPGCNLPSAVCSS